MVNCQRFVQICPKSFRPKWIFTRSIPERFFHARAGRGAGRGLPEGDANAVVHPHVVVERPDDGLGDSSVALQLDDGRSLASKEGQGPML
jgi:hypothetical protein